MPGGGFRSVRVAFDVTKALVVAPVLVGLQALQLDATASKDLHYESSAHFDPAEDLYFQCRAGGTSGDDGSPARAVADFIEVRLQYKAY
jgi:hypothetical protein